jgi:AcrR family transcriptional regulator
MNAESRNEMAAMRKSPRTYLTSEERRAEIIEAAFKCIKEVGYAKLTARKIAEHPNISLGHITYNFKDMNEVLVETYRYTSKLLVAAVSDQRAKGSKSPSEQLKIFLGTFLNPDFLKRDFLRVRIDLWSAALASDDIMRTENSLYEHFRKELSEILRQIADERTKDHDSISFLVDSITATMDGLWLDWERRKNIKAIENGLEACLLLVNCVLGSAPSVAQGGALEP